LFLSTRSGLTISGEDIGGQGDFRDRGRSRQLPTGNQPPIPLAGRFEHLIRQAQGACTRATIRLMCTNYRPPNSRIVRDMQGLEGVQMPGDGWPEEAFPGYLAPIVTRGGETATQLDGGVAPLVCSLARFGLVPRWSRDAQHGNELSRRTYNARSETVADKPSYRTPWRERQYALAPMLNYFEPCWESGRALRWRIALASGEPFAVAGLHERWTDRSSGEIVRSFTLLTVNADQHPLMGRMHRPGDEKRMLVIVPPAQYAHWLHASPERAAEMLMQDRRFDPPLAGEPAPRLRSAPAPAAPSERKEAAPAAPAQGALDF
jgi:putative SOS response-associated peptidase YedK